MICFTDKEIEAIREILDSYVHNSRSLTPELKVLRHKLTYTEEESLGPFKIKSASKHTVCFREFSLATELLEQWVTIAKNTVCSYLNSLTTFGFKLVWEKEFIIFLIEPDGTVSDRIGAFTLEDLERLIKRAKKREHLDDSYATYPARYLGTLGISVYRMRDFIIVESEDRSVLITLPLVDLKRIQSYFKTAGMSSAIPLGDNVHWFQLGEYRRIKLTRDGKNKHEIIVLGSFTFKELCDIIEWLEEKKV